MFYLIVYSSPGGGDYCFYACEHWGGKTAQDKCSGHPGGFAALLKCTLAVVKEASRHLTAGFPSPLPYRSCYCGPQMGPYGVCLWPWHHRLVTLVCLVVAMGDCQIYPMIAAGCAEVGACICDIYSMLSVWQSRPDIAAGARGVFFPCSGRMMIPASSTDRLQHDSLGRWLTAHPICFNSGSAAYYLKCMRCLCVRGVISWGVRRGCRESNQ